LVRLSVDGALTDKAQDALDEVGHAALSNRALSWSRRRVGTDDFDLFASAILTAVTGGPDQVSDDAAAVLERGLGVDRAKQDRMAGAEPWLPHELDIRTELANAGELLKEERIRPLLDLTTDEQLNCARDNVQAFVSTMTNAGYLIRETAGRWAFGIGALGAFTQDGAAEPPGQSLILLLWLSLQQAGYRENMDALVALEDQTARARADFERLRALGRAFPDVPALSSVALGRAFVDPNARDELVAALAELRRSHGAEVAAAIGAATFQTTRPVDV
jgi:hypothetical protein